MNIFRRLLHKCQLFFWVMGHNVRKSRITDRCTEFGYLANLRDSNKDRNLISPKSVSPRFTNDTKSNSEQLINSYISYRYDSPNRGFNWVNTLYINPINNGVIIKMSNRGKAKSYLLNY